MPVKDKKAWYRKNRTKELARHAAYYAKEPEKYRLRAREFGKANPEYRRSWELMTLYGLTVEKYNEISAIQNDCCAICNAHKSTVRYERLHVDHDHGSNVVRQLLCFRCNAMIGLAKDQIDIFRKAAEYLAKHVRKK